MHVVVGTRGSPLAMAQTEEVLAALRQAHPRVEFEVKKVHTQGDIAADTPLDKMPRGSFAKELETGLANGEVDMAVHSFKDLQTDLEEEFTIAAIGRRQEPRDVLVAPGFANLASMPSGSRLGTSSPRRLAQVKAYRPDLQVLPIRGNVGTRIEKANGGDFDGVIVAAAGVFRLGLRQHIAELIPPEVCLPAVGQGALAVEVRSGDRATFDIAAAADHPDTRTTVSAEMAVLHRLGGGCRVPIAAFAVADGHSLRIEGMVASSSGDTIVRSEATGLVSRPEETGRRLAQRLLDLGAGALLEEDKGQ